MEPNQQCSGKTYMECTDDNADPEPDPTDPQNQIDYTIVSSDFWSDVFASEESENESEETQDSDQPTSRGDLFQPADSQSSSDWSPSVSSASATQRSIGLLTTTALCLLLGFWSILYWFFTIYMIEL